MAERSKKGIKTCKTISFDGIISGMKSSVRVTDDGMIPVMDLIKVITHHTDNTTRKVLTRIDPKLFGASKLVKRKLPTKDGKERETKCVSLEDSVELVMILPGTAAKATRSQLAERIKPLVQRKQPTESSTRVEQSRNNINVYPCPGSTSDYNTGLAEILTTAFAYQKEALELQYKQEVELIEEEEEAEEFEILMEKKIEEMAKEHTKIEKSVAEKTEYVNSLKTRLHDITMKLKKARENVVELISDAEGWCTLTPRF